MTKINRNLIDKLYIQVRAMRIAYYKKLLKVKRIRTISEMIILASATISSTTIMITLATINPITLIISGVFSSIATVGKAIKNGLRADEYIEKLHTAYCQLNDLERDLKTCVSSKDITNFNARLSLIEDTAPVVRISISNK